MRKILPGGLDRSNPRLLRVRPANIAGTIPGLATLTSHSLICDRKWWRGHSQCLLLPRRERPQLRLPGASSGCTRRAPALQEKQVHDQGLEFLGHIRPRPPRPEAGTERREM